MSVYTQATLGEPDNFITFNDYTLNPVYRSITRQPQKYQVREQDIPIPFESGVSDFQTLIGETIYVIDGKMYPADETSYDSGIADLRAVSSLELEQTDPYTSDEGYVPYVWGDSSAATGSKQLFVKVLYVQFAEDTRQGFVVPFRIYCKIKDPTIYGATLKQANTSQSNPSQATGGAIFSVAFPVVFGASTVSVTANATNNGNVPSYPVSIDVYGPVTNPIVTNTLTGEYIQVNQSLGSGTDHLNIQYDKDTLSVTLNGTNVLNSVTSGSTYFKIKPGVNPITLSGSAVTTGAYAIVNYYDSYPLA